MKDVILNPTNATRLDIVQGIIDLIVLGELKISEMTSENELARMLNFNGRTPALREALALLTRDGIVRPRPQRGYLVREISKDEAKEILRLRASSEKLVIEKLAEQDIGKRLKRVWEIQYGLSEFAQTNDSSAFVKLEGLFFCELARLSSLYIATQAVGAWSDQLRVFHSVNPLTQDQMEQISGSNYTLLEQVEQHNYLGAVMALDTQVIMRIEVLNLQGKYEATSSQEVAYAY
jgi:DNA-binding GntR family transcriptional regulator